MTRRDSGKACEGIGLTCAAPAAYRVRPSTSDVWRHACGKHLTMVTVDAAGVNNERVITEVLR